MKTNNLNSLNNNFYNSKIMLPLTLMGGKLPDHIHKMRMITSGSTITIMLEVEGLNGDNFHVKLNSNNTLMVIVAIPRVIHAPAVTAKRNSGDYDVFMKSEVKIPSGYSELIKAKSVGNILIIMLSKEGKSAGEYKLQNRAVS